MSAFSRPGAFGSTSGRFRPLDETRITSRSLFSSLPFGTQSVVLDLSAVGNFDDVERRETVSVSDPMWCVNTVSGCGCASGYVYRNAMREGAPIRELIKAAPDEVIQVLRDHTVKRLGSFKVKDTEAVIAFRGHYMLTRGSDTAGDQNYARNWTQIIENEVKRHPGKALYSQGGWEEEVTLTAYCVNMKNAAAGRENGLLSPLVEKAQSGVASNVLWDFPAVRAVIEYKWCHWARKYLGYEFILYLGWLLCFTGFMISYIKEDLTSAIKDQDRGGKYLAIQAYFLDVFSILFMCPFLLIEYNTIRFYGLRWIQPWNIIDSCAYVLQVLLTFGHLTHIWGTNAYSTLLAIQCILLFIKVQYFARVFGEGTAFVEVIARVILKARFFLMFLALMMIAMALSFAALYKLDAEENEAKDTEEDFGNIVRSLVTVYAVLLGDFNSAYVFDTSNRVIKGLFFLALQVTMAIALINLLVAVMTEAYVSIMEEQRIMFNMGRAQVMDELEIALPASYGPTLKPYCHFIVMEKKDIKPPTLSADLGESTLIRQQTDLNAKVVELTATVQEMKAAMAEMASKFE